MLVDLQVLVLEWLSFLLVSLLAVWVTVWAPWYWKLLKQCLTWLFGSNFDDLEQPRGRIDRQEASDDEENNLSRADNVPHTVSNILSCSRAAEEVVLALGLRILISGRSEE